MLYVASEWVILGLEPNMKKKKKIPKTTLCNLIPFVHILDSDLQVRDVWDNGRWRLNNLFTHLMML